MKKKLAGLLLFSQAVSQDVKIDKSNYKEHLCGPELFKRTNVVAESQPQWLTDAEVQHIKGGYQVYCENREQHEQAVSDKKSHGPFYKTNCFQKTNDLIAPEQCIEKTGIYYALVCQDLKKGKTDMPEAWNVAVRDFKECARPSR